MDKASLLATICLLLLFSCTATYTSTEAEIVDLEINSGSNGNYKATIEYWVDSVRYTDTFEIEMEKLIEDSISTPAPGIRFLIEYNVQNPSDNRIDFREKAKYIN